MNRDHRNDGAFEYCEPRCEYPRIDRTLYRTRSLDMCPCDIFLSSETLPTSRMYRCLHRSLHFDARRIIVYGHPLRDYRTPSDDRLLFTPVDTESHISHALLRTLIHPRAPLILDRWRSEYLPPAYDVSIYILYFEYCYFPDGFDPPRIYLDHLIRGTHPPRYEYGEHMNRRYRYDRNYSDKMYEYISPHRSRDIHSQTEEWFSFLSRDRTEWYADDLSRYIRESILILHYSHHSLPYHLSHPSLYHDSR